jgi:hypothetical protein
MTSGFADQGVKPAWTNMGSSFFFKGVRMAGTKWQTVSSSVRR